MHTLRKPKANFTMVPNGVLCDRDISLKAKGLYALMFSKPDGWTFYEDTLVAESKDARDATRAALKELVDSGWLSRTRQRGANKQFQPYEYEMHLTVTKAPSVKKSRVGKSDMGGAEPHRIFRSGKAEAENPTLNNTLHTNTDDNKTNMVTPPSDKRNGFDKSLAGVLRERMGGGQRRVLDTGQALRDILEPFGGKVPTDWIPGAVVMYKMTLVDAQEAAKTFVFYYTKGNGCDVRREDVGAWAEAWGKWCKGAKERRAK